MQSQHGTVCAVAVFLWGRHTPSSTLYTQATLRSLPRRTLSSLALSLLEGHGAMPSTCSKASLCCLSKAAKEIAQNAGSHSSTDVTKASCTLTSAKALSPLKWALFFHPVSGAVHHASLVALAERRLRAALGWRWTGGQGLGPSASGPPGSKHSSCPRELSQKTPGGWDEMKKQ